MASDEHVSRILNGVVRSLELINEYLPKVLNQIDCLISYSNQFQETADLDASSEGLVTKLSEVIELALLFIYKVNDVNGYISGSLFKDEADKLKDRGADDDFEASLVFIDKLLNECSEQYMEYKEKSSEIERECISVETTCREKARKARVAKNHTRGIGGATTGAAAVGTAAVGIKASFVAGAFTFGVGTVIGLAATAAVVGIGGVTTHTMASSHKEAEDAYTALTTECRCLKKSCRSMNRQLLKIHTNFSHLHSQVDQLKWLVDNHPNRLHAYVAFENLRQTSRRCHYHSSRVQAELKKKNRQLELRG